MKLFLYHFIKVNIQFPVYSNQEKNILKLTGSVVHIIADVNLHLLH